MPSSLLTPMLFDRIGWLLVHSLWQFTLIALVMFVALRLLQRLSARVRYWTCLSGLAAIVVVPVLTWRFLPEYVLPPAAISSDILELAGSKPTAAVIPE